MGANHTTTDVVVVGGGIIGMSISWCLARRGIAVTCCDPHPGQGASHVAGGMLAPVSEVVPGEDALLQLGLASSKRWPDFAAALEEESGCTIDFSTAGTVIVARDNDDAEAIDALADFRRRLGLSVERLRSRELRSLEPALSPRTRGGLRVDGDHSVDPRAVLSALGAANRRAGVTMRATSVAAIRDEGGQVRGVDLADGTRIDAPVVVAAPGHAAGRLPGMEPALPVRPVKGQVLVLRGEPLVARTIRGLDVYLVPRSDGRLIVGATVEDRGEDYRVTAGGVWSLLDKAQLLVPDVAELELLEAVAGMRPATPDNAPLLGQMADVAGLIVATGHWRGGILLTPITAAVVTALVTGTPPPIDLTPFAPERTSEVA